MKLQITHVTSYSYGDAVADSVNEIRLTPCTNERQACYHHTITVEPNTSLYSYEDYFGNRVHSFSVNALHRKLVIRSTTTVVTRPAGEQHGGGDGGRDSGRDGGRDGGRDSENASGYNAEWELLASEDFRNKYAEYLLPTGYTTATPEVLQFAGLGTQGLPPGGGVQLDGEDSVEERQSVEDWASQISTRIRTEFVYDPSATNVQTTVADMFGNRRGVCQDFAHLMIAICRSAAVPARYVSGYHFVGDLQGGMGDFQQASHAWVEAYIPGRGWCGYDPTNADPIGERYVKLGHGRDYADIVPVKGVYRGTGKQVLDVAVDVRRLDQD